MPNTKFPIVGIGASAGGLEALEQFLSHVPVGSGMAFVVIQHLDPTQKGMLPELLQRATAMPVVQAGNQMKVAPGCVYVIPPNKDLSILQGILYLLEPMAPRGFRLPIDLFFAALADDLHELAIGVILSGMGSDGTAGLRAIKKKAGLALVQDPKSAKFDSMPHSAINAGLADIVAPAEDLPGKIANFKQYARLNARGLLAPAAQIVSQSGGLEKIILLLRQHTGHDFSDYKVSTLYRRVERRMDIHQIGEIGNYYLFLRENQQELELLFKELLIGVTNFFRDPASWAALQTNGWPILLAAQPEGGVLRAWVAGCSTGEEAYSLCISFKEAIERIKPAASFSLQVFATDLDPDAIARARNGYYPASIAADVSSERLNCYFVKREQGYTVCKEIREMVIFAQQNLAMDPPFTRLDLLLCRNLLIYFNQDLQKRLLPLFHYSLKPGALLFLGSAESISSYNELFTPLDAKERLYQRSLSPLRASEVEFPSRLMPIGHPMLEVAHNLPVPTNLQALADQVLLQRVAPAAVLVNAEGDILYVSGHTGKYLEVPAGKANWNIHAMLRDALRRELSVALPKALREGESVVRRGIRLGNKGDNLFVDLSVLAIDKPEALRGMAMISFAEVPDPALRETGNSTASPGLGSSKEAELALRQAHEESQMIRQAMQTQQEELRAANEELQSTNEELQSTNEELTTSKEEMQSLNEELQTVNAEMQSKMDELSSVSGDMKNLLNSTEIATIFLDNDLHIRRFTTFAKHLFKLIPVDVGRPLSDITTNLQYQELDEEAREVLRSLVFSEKEIETNDQRWFKVRIMPYRTLANMIDGVVITFTDISLAKQLEAQLRALSRPSPQGS